MTEKICLLNIMPNYLLFKTKDLIETTDYTDIHR
jgi:hypothetical protein